MDFKSIISTPLEAGTSILDAHRLPSFLAPALEYTSQRLADKGLHITLVVARRDYQLPSNTESTSMTVSTDVPVTGLPSPPCSPKSPDVVACGPNFTAIKSLVRSGSQHSLRIMNKPDSRKSQRSKTWPLSKKSPITSLFDGSSGSPRLQWPHAPNNSSCAPKTPKTPATPASIITSNPSTRTTAFRGPLESEGGIRLIYTTTLGPRAYKLVTATLARAARKFNLSTPLTAHEPSTYDLPPVVLHGSILQNEILHSSEGLTLLSLDHLYTFKAALNHYAATRCDPGSQFRLEDAVDELRRYVLSTAGGRRRLLKSVLVTAYDWLGLINDLALKEVMKMYSRAYGGATDMGVEDDLVRDAAQAVAASQALAKIVDGDHKLRLVTSVPEPPPKSAARMSRQTAAGSATTPVATPALGSPVSLDDKRSVSSATTVSTPTSAQSQQLLSPMSGHWTSEDDSSWADEGKVNIMNTAPVKVLELTRAKKGGIDTLAEEEKVTQEGQILGDETSVATKATTLEPKTPTDPLRKTPPISPGPPVSTHKIPSPRISSRDSLPSLRIQTSFTTPSKSKTIPRRKKTPIPSTRRPRQKDLGVLPIRPSPIDKEIRIEITMTDESDTESVLTEFEDADLTARSPAKTPGGSLWLGIDEILGSTGTRGRRCGSGSLRHHRRRSSSLHELQTPGGGRLGPDTPNGYEDISPITRGEWGFLMVSDPFKTKTAAVSCV